MTANEEYRPLDLLVTHHQAPSNELPNTHNIVFPMTMGGVIQRGMPGQHALAYREPSIALTDGQGIPDQLDNNPKLYNIIMCMIHVALEDTMHADPEKSVLAKIGVKLAHPETFTGVSQSEFCRSRVVTHPKKFRTELKASHPKHIASHPNACEGLTRES